MDAKISTNAVKARVLQAAFVTTQMEGTGVHVEQEGSIPGKAIHATLIPA